MINQSRRTLLKGMGYGMAALASVGASSTAMAATLSDTPVNQSLQFIQPNKNVTVYLQQPEGKERVSLVNLTSAPIIVDRNKPVSLKQINGSLVLTLNSAAEGDVVLKPGSGLVIEVDAGRQHIAGNSDRSDELTSYVNIKSEHTALNGKIAATAYNSYFA